MHIAALFVVSEMRLASRYRIVQPALLLRVLWLPTRSLHSHEKQGKTKKQGQTTRDINWHLQTLARTRRCIFLHNFSLYCHAFKNEKGNCIAGIASTAVTLLTQTTLFPRTSSIKTRASFQLLCHSSLYTSVLFRLLWRRSFSDH